MKIVVRDDIIKLESFVAAAAKFRKYLEVIAGCGGYCFLEQFERIWNKEDARKMEKANFIKTDYFSRYKFVRLTSTALKYLYYRDDERDFSGIPKNTISVRNLTSKPSEKVLFSSAIYFELYHRNMPYFSKDYHMELLEIQLNKDYSEKIKKEEKIIETTTYKLNYLTNVKINMIEDLFKTEKDNKKLLSSLIESFEEEGSRLESKKNLLNKNTCEIERVKKWQQDTTEILRSSSYVSNTMEEIKDTLNDSTDEIKESKKKLKILKELRISLIKKRMRLLKDLWSIGTSRRLSVFIIKKQ